MKVYTRPRPLPVGLVRPGDQVALSNGNRPIESEAVYIDADLLDKVTWTVVHELTGDPAGPTRTVRHTYGEQAIARGHCVMVREAIDIDPWTYVERVTDARIPAPR